MAATPVSERAPIADLTVASHRGEYRVSFEERPFAALAPADAGQRHFIVDARVAGLYAAPLAGVLGAPSVLLIEASEASKSLERFGAYVEHLVGHGVKRSHRLVAIGGGVVQDIVCFLASTLLRGLEWEFVPTTLLAQADSCIGSKSSVNVGDTKNILGTFWPPRHIHVCTALLRTLAARDLRSGVGEMIKVHAIDGPASFERIAADYDAILGDEAVMAGYIRGSLEIKRRIIEIDEFDRGLRNVMNYGHSFGHAIESATDFAVPHGIAVTLGMDMANHTAVALGRMDAGHLRRMRGLLRRNAGEYTAAAVPAEAFFKALGRDKKNVDAGLSLILPDAAARIERVTVPFDARFRAICEEYFAAAATP